ncbi:MAG: M67 family metallopeptidase [Magnetococcales bacterium]|nr:M67 family metallopeptidase [Magnetococcales bacterium]MBF0321561.1 M67 family metallopeptidase [Magnetococcales bacterium]
MWTIPRSIVNHILGHAQRTAPLECVGVLSGQGRQVTGWHPLPNIQTDPRRFFADPKTQITLFRELRERGQSIVAIYHSHPAGPPAPSPADLAESTHPDALYLIVSLGTLGRLDLGGFLLREGRSEAQELRIVEG